MHSIILLVAIQCVTAQAVAPREYPPGREPYYYGSDNIPWYDSYGRLRYGPQGIPARQYEEQRKRKDDYDAWRENLYRQVPPVPPAPPQDRGIEPGYPPPAP